MKEYYYLHKNGDLIFKNYCDSADLMESDLVKMFWRWQNDRETAWTILVEALSLGANIIRIKELAMKWGCNDEDAVKYAEVIGCLLWQDGDQKTATEKDFTNLQECPCGFGDSYLEAMADLCKQMGYKSQKLWGTSFKKLLEPNGEEGR